MSDLVFDGAENSNGIVFEVGMSEIQNDVSTTNFSRIGSLRPTALMYTSGVGATADLPHLSVLVLGLERWEQQYLKMGAIPRIVEPRLLNAVKRQLGPSVSELRTSSPTKTNGNTDRIRLAIFTKAVEERAEVQPRHLTVL